MRSILFMALAGALVSAGPAVAQDNSRSRGDQRSDRDNAAPIKKTSGEIVSTRKVRLRNSDVQHLLARIRLDNDRLQVVDLGPANNPDLKNLSLNAGDRISATGRMVDTGTAEVVFAASVRSGDEQVKIERRADLPGGIETAIPARRDDREADRSERTAVQERSIRGKITRTKRVDWRGSDRREFVALVETNDGDTVIVDLGPTTGLKDARIRTGQQISARGFMAPVGEHKVLFATRLDFGDHSMTINRLADRPKMETLRGTVIRSKRVDWRDSDRREFVALVKPESGEPVIVDLGPTTGLRDAGVETGRPITVRGSFRQVGDKRVFFADHLTTAETSTAINRQFNPGGEPRTLSGRVARQREVGLRNGVDRNVIVLIETPEGRQEADLGSADRARDLGIREGDKITVKGRVFDVNGRPILMVTDVTANGESHRIDRPMRRESMKPSDDDMRRRDEDFRRGVNDGRRRDEDSRRYDND